MRVLLVQQEMGRRVRAKPIYPLGLAYIASVLAKKYEVQIFDPNLYNLPDSFGQLSRLVKVFSPDVVGVSIKYIDTTDRLDPFVFYNTVPAMINIIKRASPSTKVIAGGAGFSMFPEEIMSDTADIDFGIYLEGEDSFPELVDNLHAPGEVKGVFYREDGRVRFTGARPFVAFENLSPPAKESDIIDVSRYVTDDYQTFGIQAKRGCVFKCAYCNYPFLNGGTLRLRNPKDVVDEIELMIERHGMRTFTFADNVFNVPLEHAEDVCNEIVKRNLKVEWGAWFDISQFTEDLLALAVKAGCRYVDFSPDAVTKEGLEILGKQADMQDISKSFQLAKDKKEIFVSYNLFCTYPKQNLKGALATIRWFFKIMMGLFGRARVYIGWIRIMPNTRIHRLAMEEGFIDDSTSLFVKDAKELRRLFYTKKSLWCVDLFFTCLSNVLEHIAKPVLKPIFRLSGVKYRFYY